MTDVTHQTQTQEAQMGDYFALMKPRVMQLVVFTALVGLLVAPVGINPFIGFVAVLCIAVGAGASGALNMWWDADIDAIMKRTVDRPIPSGAVEPGEALAMRVINGKRGVMAAEVQAWEAAVGSDESGDT